jgi:hypothetical protein
MTAADDTAVPGEVDRAVRDYLETVTPAKRRMDAERLLDLMSRVTGEPPALEYGTIIGFGRYHYKYESGREGESAAAGFAPRKAATTIYLADGIGRYTEQLARLGPHKTGVGCLYIKDLDKVDLDVLESMVRESFRTLTGGTYPHRAREGGHSG